MPITIRDLIRTALRMRPDRIIVGECRGAETFDMLQALNTGHDGGLSTAHGNSCRDILSRLEMMVLMGMDLPLAAIRQQIASGIDIIVHLGRLRDKSRRVLEIAVMDGGKCILQLRGVRPFLSDKYDITKHPKYKMLSDYDKRNAFDIEKYRSRKLVVKPTQTFDLYDMGEVEAD